MTDVPDEVQRWTAKRKAAVVINLGGHRLMVSDTLDVLCGITGCTPQIIRHAAQHGDARDAWADLARARALLDYAPRTSLKAGLRAEWRWLSCLFTGRQPGYAD